ncbi:MAG: Na+/H+ antiporter subunit E [Halioglobus sp.]|nr:Na+/H+ antiporter subunit E [Halioglobus sp.]
MGPPPNRRARPVSLQLVVLLAALWLALTGGAGVLFGTVAVALAALASTWLAPMQFTRFSLPGLARFTVYFLGRSVAGGVDVARRALAPGLPLHIIDTSYAISLPPGQARTVFTAVVSLLPGTLARDLIGDTLWVHSIAGDPGADLKTLERRVAALFDVALEGG